MLPELEGSAPSNRDRFNADATRFRIRDAVVRTLCTAAASQPLVLLLEDLHAAAPDCLEVIVGLAMQVREQPLAIITSYRDVGAAVNAALTHTLTELTRSSALRLPLPLRGIDLDAVTAMLAHRTNESIAARLCKSVYQKTGGNPLFLTELLGHLLQLMGLQQLPAGGALHAILAIEQIGAAASRREHRAGIWQGFDLAAGCLAVIAIAVRAQDRSARCRQFDAATRASGDCHALRCFRHWLSWRCSRSRQQVR